MRLNIVQDSSLKILDFVLFCVKTVIKYGIGIQEGSSQAVQLQDFG